MTTRRARLFVLSSLLAVSAAAQQPAAADLAIGSLFIVPELKRIDVVFSRPVTASAANLAPANVTVQSTPPITVRRIIPAPGFQRRLRIEYDGDLSMGSQVTVTFNTIEYPSGQTTLTAHNLSLTDRVETVEARLNRVRTAIAETPKTTREKNIFASGFVVTASEGTQGGADIALNDVLGKLENTSTFLNIRKATLEGADHRNFEAGLRHRTPILFAGARQDLRRMRPGASPEDIADALLNLQNRWLSGALFDLAGKLEGQATNFNVANFVGETALQFRSTVRKLGARNGFWRGFVMPFAFEGGKHLSENGQNGTAPTPGTASDVEWIARYKAGAGMTLFYDNPGANLPFKRVELELEAVFRNLFLTERMFNEETKTVDDTGKGIRGYGQADLKLFVQETNAGRWGVKLTYNRGSLPPVFSKVDSFQFGFLFESAN